MMANYISRYFLMYWFEPTEKEITIFFYKFRWPCVGLRPFVKIFLFSHECKHSDFRSSFAFFYVIFLWFRQNQNNMQWDSLLQWRDQRNAQPWIWLQMVFPHSIHTFFRVLLTRQLHHVRVKKMPTIATHDNCLEKLTNRHWNLQNKTKQKKRQRQKQQK